MITTEGEIRWIKRTGLLVIIWHIDKVEYWDERRHFCIKPFYNLFKKFTS